MTKLHDLQALGQSIWYDNIRRALLDSGELSEWIQRGVTGVTSNPTIFEKAIIGSTDYDQPLLRLAEQDLTVQEIFERLALEDIGRTADLLLPVYERTAGVDGFVSIEVSPTLAYDVEGTVLEARRLFEQLARPNVMIKVPATVAGVEAIQWLIGEGINVNVNLIFGLSRYRQVAEAYLTGLERRLAQRDAVDAIRSVASFFVSRVDTAVDRALDRIGVGSAAADSLRGRIAIANARQAYQHFREVFAGQRWQALAEQGAAVQRPLWASTSTKDPQYRDTRYVEALIGTDTVNTVPPATLLAFVDHGRVAETVEADLEQTQDDLQTLSGLGIDLNEITEELLQAGVAAFADSYQSLMSAIAEKRAQLVDGWRPLSAELGEYLEPVDEAVQEVQQQQILPRIWRRDHTVWHPDPTEIENRLGWLTTAEMMLDNLHRLRALTKGVLADGYRQLVLLGMGGSSLAAEVFHRTFGVRKSHLEFHLLDSTDPEAVIELDRQLDYSRTLFIVATKSGGTIETLSFFKYFYNQVVGDLGRENAGPHFVAITDPGSPLTELAQRHDFRATYLNDPNIGGRYSALSYFGLVPAALIGVEIEPILERARAAVCGSDSCVEAEDSPAAWLGCAMAELAKLGRDKLTLITDPALESFGAWVEQLIAESSGKHGTGVLPVVGERLGEVEQYGDDRLFVQLTLDGVAETNGEPPGRSDTAGDKGDQIVQPAIAERLERIRAAGHPLIRMRLRDLDDLGGQFFLWEMATAIAGHRLGIQPFDQPNVEAAKRLAKEMVAEYQQRGQLTQEPPALSENGMELYGRVESASLTEALESFLKASERRSYLAIQAYLPPGPQVAELLQQIRHSLRDRTRLATTVGYGPRYLHSTGQLHKGDGGKGLFLMLTTDDAEDLAIPNEAGSPESSLTFGVLKAAQARGDRSALEQAGRQVLQIHLTDETLSGLQQLLSAAQAV